MSQTKPRQAAPDPPPSKEATTTNTSLAEKHPASSGDQSASALVKDALVQRVSDPLSVGDGQYRFPSLWHLCWFLQTNLPGTTNSSIADIARAVRLACDMVRNPDITDVKCGWIPSPLGPHECWMLLQWRSVHGQNLPPNSLVVSFSHDLLLPWIADAWIPCPNELPRSEFAEEFSRSDGPVFNTHVRQLACAMAWSPMIPQMTSHMPELPPHEEQWWEKYRRNRKVYSYKTPDPPVPEKERVKLLLSTLVLYNALFDRYEKQHSKGRTSIANDLPNSRVVWGCTNWFLDLCLPACLSNFSRVSYRFVKPYFDKKDNDIED